MNISNIKIQNIDTQDQNEPIHKNLVPGTVLTFEEFIDELHGFSRSEFDANRQVGRGASSNSTSNTSHGGTIAWKNPFEKKPEDKPQTTQKPTNPFETAAKRDQERKAAVHAAAAKHVQAGNHKQAFDSAYQLAHAHAKEDRYSDESAHEIATRKAKTAVKTAQDNLSKR